MFGAGGCQNDCRARLQDRKLLYQFSTKLYIKVSFHFITPFRKRLTILLLDLILNGQHFERFGRILLVDDLSARQIFMQNFFVLGLKLESDRQSF